MRRFLRASGPLVAFAAFICSAAAEESDSSPFPRCPPAEVGMSAEAVEALADRVRELVEQDEVVGAEIHVIKRRHTVLHRAFGMADRDDGRPLAADSIYCVRSMTKPLTGSAIQMLLDEGALDLSTEVRTIVPAFDAPRLEDVTIEHLLTHTSGLPFTAISRPLTEYRGLLDVAGDAAQHGLSFAPGAGFQYSDAGTDTLGAVIEQLTGDTAGEVIRQRILGPLGMVDSIILLGDDGASDAAARIPSAYSGGPGYWERHWSPHAEPLFPLFLTSQSLYASTTDYARFLALWIDRGVAGDRRLLSEAAVERAFAPGEVIEQYETGFPGLEVTYGHQWMLFHPTAESGLQPTVFGHNGSDGTYAWAWPAEDLIVLYFTQCRGSASGTHLERDLHTLLIEDDVDGFHERRRREAAAAAELARYHGLYWDEDVASAYYDVTARSGRLVVTRPGRFRREFLQSDEPGVFRSEGGGGTTLHFELPDDGPATAMLIHSASGRRERQVRHRHDPSLPAVEEVRALVQEAHRIDRISDLGAVRRTGRMQSSATAGPVEFTFDATRQHFAATGAARSEVFSDGDRVLLSMQGGPFVEQKGVAREQMLLDHPSITFGGWDDSFRSVEVLKRIRHGDRDHLLVRMVPQEGAAANLIIDEQTGRVVAQDRIEFIPGMGHVGVAMTFEDYRNVGPVALPFRTVSRYASPLIGEVRIEYDAFDVGEDAAVALRHDG